MCEENKTGRIKTRKRKDGGKNDMMRWGEGLNKKRKNGRIRGREGQKDRK